MPKPKASILVVFYSRDGSIEALAKAVSEVTLTSTGMYPSVPRRLFAGTVVSVLIRKM
jgi:hypothetical protein